MKMQRRLSAKPQQGVAIVAVMIFTALLLVMGLASTVMSRKSQSMVTMMSQKQQAGLITTEALTDTMVQVADAYASYDPSGSPNTFGSFPITPVSMALIDGNAFIPLLDGANASGGNSATTINLASGAFTMAVPMASYVNPANEGAAPTAQYTCTNGCDAPNVPMTFIANVLSQHQGSVSNLKANILVQPMQADDFAGLAGNDGSSIGDDFYQHVSIHQNDNPFYAVNDRAKREYIFMQNVTNIYNAANSARTSFRSYLESKAIRKRYCEGYYTTEVTKNMHAETVSVPDVNDPHTTHNIAVKAGVSDRVDTKFIKDPTSLAQAATKNDLSFITRMSQRVANISSGITRNPNTMPVVTYGETTNPSVTVSGSTVAVTWYEAATQRTRTTNYDARQYKTFYFAGDVTFTGNSYVGEPNLVFASNGNIRFKGSVLAQSGKVKQNSCLDADADNPLCQVDRNTLRGLRANKPAFLTDQNILIDTDADTLTRGAKFAYVSAGPISSLTSEDAYSRTVPALVLYGDYYAGRRFVFSDGGQIHPTSTYRILGIYGSLTAMKVYPFSEIRSNGHDCMMVGFDIRLYPIHREPTSNPANSDTGDLVNTGAGAGQPGKIYVVSVE